MDPGLRRRARVLSRLTMRSAQAYRRQVRVVNGLTRSRRRPGRDSSRMRGDVEIAQRWTTRRDGSLLRLLVVRPPYRMTRCPVCCGCTAAATRAEGRS
jgi:hypothetical protein